MGEQTLPLRNALVRIESSARGSGREVAAAMADVGERAIKLELSRSSHSLGTKTPAQPYIEPPSLITGRLRQSVRRTRLYRNGGLWEAHVAPTTVYARIQELGGHAGRNRKVYIPPRPYVRPARNRSAEQARKAAIKVFRAATGI